MAKQQPKIFSDKIFYYESVLENPKEVIDKIEAFSYDESKEMLISDWHTWTASHDSYVFGERKTTNISFYESSSKEMQDVYNTLNKVLSIYSEDYSKSLSIPLGTQRPISISKYFSGAFMGSHTDSSPTPTTENVSGVLYLNDSYEGGEISFPQQGVKIKPSAGSLVLFPSVPPFYHESLAVISGTKYMCPAFWHLSN